MDEEEEEFYDSLEEDQNFEDARNPSDTLIIIPENESSQSQYEFAGLPVNDKLVKDLQKSTKIPLYMGETDKDDLKINQKFVQIVGCPKKSNTCISCETSGKPKAKLSNLVKKKTDTSYWNIYCSKNSGPAKSDSENNDMMRSLYGSTTNKTFTSFSGSCCLSGSTWDAPSMFEKYMPKKYGTKKTDFPTFNENEMFYEIDNMKSVSQVDMVKENSSKSSSDKILKTKSTTSNISVRPLTLKNIVPNQSKLEMLKKQQEYGLRVNSRNRARLLSKIKQELNKKELNNKKLSIKELKNKEISNKDLNTDDD